MSSESAVRRRADLDNLSQLGMRSDVMERVMMKMAQQIDVLQTQLKEDEAVVDALATAGSGGAPINQKLQPSTSLRQQSVTSQVK